MGNSVVKEHCDTARKTGLFKLSQKKLTEFPVALFHVKSQLRILDLSDNKLMALPTEIGEFENLKYLKLNKNRIALLPDSVCNLKKLEGLSLCYNALKTLPQSLSQLKHLKEVYLSGNRLSEFPTVFKEIVSLDVLDLSKNKITSIPDDVAQVYAVELILNQNQISSISEEIAKCPRLRTLRLEENCLELSAIPLKMLSDSNISVLTLENNLFEMKKLMQLEGYEHYMERYTAVKKKLF